MVNPIQSLKFAAVAGVCSLGVVAADVALASNSTASDVADSSQATLVAQAGTIVDVAAGNDQFSTLVSAVQAAGLVDTLSGPGPFTVFAPTNAAFAALPPEALNALLEPQNQDLLTEVLTYHVVADELGADSVVTASTIETLNGPVDVNVVDGTVMINQADVILADVDASNGVIHAIDAVLIPDGVISTLEARMAETETAPAATDEPVRGLW